MKGSKGGRLWGDAHMVEEIRVKDLFLIRERIKDA
jgi:hypothetical protein